MKREASDADIKNVWNLSSALPISFHGVVRKRSDDFIFTKKDNPSDNVPSLISLFGSI
jgi:hypothetical protein